MDPFQLAMDVKRRAEEATAALRKQPSVPKFHENGTLSRKPIDMRQISTPKLEYASTSMEAVPLQSPGMLNTPPADSPRPGKGFFKFRGTLRGKPPGIEEYARAGSPRPNGLASPGLLSPATPTNKQPSPPSSAGVKKGSFMSRFRKARPNEPATPDARYDTVPLTAALSGMQLPTPPTPSPDIARSAPALSNVIFTGMPRHMQDLSPVDPEPPMMFGTSPPTPMTLQSPPVRKQVPSEEPAPERHAQQPSQDEQALKQFFDAASSLGLDEAALSEILARSPSVKSNGTWKQSARFTSTSAQSQTRPSIEQIIPSITQSRPSGEAYRSRSPTASEGRPSLDATFQLHGPPPRSDSLRKNAVSPTASEFGTLDERDRADETIVPTRRVPVRTDSTRTKRSTVLRRTIIFSSDPRLSTMDLNALVGKPTMAPPPLPTSKQRRRASTTSVQSGRSLVERIPTPPPPQARAGGSKRFSTEGSPPVPRLPGSMGGRGADANLQTPMSAPAGKLEYPSTYDSL
jgi:serine/arginine repetitive matrix protein 2